MGEAAALLAKIVADDVFREWAYVVEVLYRTDGNDGEAIVAGQGDYFEVWNPADWNQQMDQLQDIETNNQRFATLDLSRGFA